MINHRVLSKEKKRRNHEHHEEEPNRNAKPACRNSPLTTFTRHFAIKKMQSMRWRKSIPLTWNIDLFDAGPRTSSTQSAGKLRRFYFIASGPESTPSRSVCAPTDPEPTQQSLAAA
jgi:hypothetical protein